MSETPIPFPENLEVDSTETGARDSDYTEIKLSICIASYKRGDVIGQTLESIAQQLTPEVEVVVFDGNSGDNTRSAVLEYHELNPNIRYFNEEINSGVDQDFDKAVGYARGKFCWLMTDDDLLEEQAIAQVMRELQSNPELVVVDAKVMNSDFSRTLQNSRMFLNQDLYFDSANDHFLEAAGDQLSFIGCVIINRELWLSRERAQFYGSLFIHVGVILQSPPIQKIIVLAKPLVKIRYGNAMWTPRSFEIWMFLWPFIIWSFPGFSDSAKQSVCPRQPWRDSMSLLKHRAKGSYTSKVHRQFIRDISSGWVRWRTRSIACIPASLANFCAVAYVVILNRQARMGLNDLLESPHASIASRFLSRALPLSDLHK